MTVVENKWLSGPYAPIPGDVTATELEVIGTLPTELNGRYLRNGPNPITPVDPATHHWFIGDGMVHGVRLREGRADWYRARHGAQHGGERAARRGAGARRAPRRLRRRQHQRDRPGRQDPTPSSRRAPARWSSPTSSTRCATPTSRARSRTATPPTRRSTRPPASCTPLAYHWALPHLQYIVIGADGLVEKVSPIDVTDGPMVHDCSITERWMVVYDLPVLFDLDVAMSGAGFPYTWKDDRPARVGLIPLGGDGADVRWFEVEPCYVFHPLNAHDDGDRVVLDVVRYDRMFDAKRLGPDDAAPAAVALDARPHHRHRARGAARRPALRVPARRRAPRRPAAPLGLRRRGAPRRRRPRQRVRRRPRAHRRQDRRPVGDRPRRRPRRRRVVDGPAPRRGRRGRRLAREPRLRQGHRPRRAASCSPPPTPAPVRWRGSCCPTASRWASTATGCPTPPDRVGQRRLVVDEALADGGGHGFELRVGAELGEHRLHVVADRVHAQVQLLGDGLVRLTAGEVAEELQLPPGEVGAHRLAACGSASGGAGRAGPARSAPRPRRPPARRRPPP